MRTLHQIKPERQIKPNPSFYLDNFTNSIYDLNTALETLRFSYLNTVYNLNTISPNQTYVFGTNDDITYTIPYTITNG